MKGLFIFIFISIAHLKGFAQIQFLETFDTKRSINGWKVKSNGVIKHTDHFTFNGETFYKNTKDSFFVFYDTTFNWNYSFTLFKKFKAIKAEEIRFGFANFSNDKEDYFYYSCTILDKNKNPLLSFTFPKYSSSNLIYITGGGVGLATKQDTMWQKADSMEIIFHFNPAHPYDSIERMVVIDEISLDKVFASFKTQTTTSFEVFPNPASKTFHFKFPAFMKPEQINLYDYTGRLIISNYQRDVLNVESIKNGFYFISILFENGDTATQKVEIK